MSGRGPCYMRSSLKLAVRAGLIVVVNTDVGECSVNLVNLLRYLRHLKRLTAGLGPAPNPWHTTTDHIKVSRILRMLDGFRCKVNKSLNQSYQISECRQNAPV